MKNKWRACVIGMGPIGNLHAKIYKEIETVELAGVCDVVTERAAEASLRHGVPCYTDTAEMLQALKPDIVSVATGGYEYASDHLLPTLQALRSGAHVLTEKPISHSLEEAALMVDTAKRLNRCFAIDFNHRFTPAARAAKAWQDEGAVGHLLFCNMALWIGKPGQFGSPYFHLKALNPHSMEIMRYFMGSVEAVQCFALKAPGRDLWSTASINLRFACGAVGHLTSSYDIARGHPMERCEVAGLNGRFVIDDMWREATLYPADNPVKRVYTNPVFGGVEGFDDTFAERIRFFVQQVQDGVPPEEIDGSGAQGLEAQRVIHAAIASLETGRVVYVKEMFPHTS